MLEAALGGLAGGVLRLAPEVMKFMDRKNERAHELAMFGHQLEADKLKGDQALTLARAEADQARDTGELNALLAAITAQGKMTGVGWVDALNSLVRPFLTYWWCIGIYSWVLWSRWRLLTTVHDIDPNVAIVQLFGSFEQGLVASIFAFWFVDRSLRHGAGVGR